MNPYEKAIVQSFIDKYIEDEKAREKEMDNKRKSGTVRRRGRRT